jgi:hypothetical protein
MREGGFALAGALVLSVVVVVVVAFAGAANAAQLVQPAASPYRVTLDAGSHPQPFTIVASGFAPDQQVFVEQCDGTSPSAPNWDPTIDCDSGSSPAPVVAGSDGRVTFPAGDLNHRFLPFVGESPQSEFSCLAAGATAGAAGVPSFSTCQVRVSSNNAAVTADQLMFTIALPAGATPPPTTVPSASSTTSTTPGGSTSTTRGATGKATSTTARAAKRSPSTTIGAGLPTGAAKAAGGSSGSSGRSVAWLIAAIVLVAGIVGYGWAWRRKRAAASP